MPATRFHPDIVHNHSPKFCDEFVSVDMLNNPEIVGRCAIAGIDEDGSTISCSKKPAGLVCGVELILVSLGLNHHCRTNDARANSSMRLGLKKEAK